MDYLKSILDPRRERIRLPGIDPDAGADEMVPPVESPSLERVGRLAEPRVDAPISFDEFSEAVLLPESRGSNGEPAPAQKKEMKPKQEETPAGSFPWRMMAMLVLALLAQGALDPPLRSETMGLARYLLAFGFGIWGYLAGEIRLPSLPVARSLDDPLSIGRVSTLLLLPMAGFSFLFFTGNQFTFLNVLLWGVTIFVSFRLFWLQERAAISLQDRFTGWIQAIRTPANLRWLILLVLAAGLVLFFRFYRLGDVPPQMFSDHAEKLQDVQDVLNGQRRIFFPRNTGREFLQMYITAFAASVLDFGLTFMALKMGAALAGLLTLPYIYRLGVELANRRVGLIAMVLAGTSYWLNVITRVSLRFFLYPMFAAPVLFHVFRGLRTGNRKDFIWAGFFLGLGLHGYSTFRFLPILVALLFVLFFLHARSQWRSGQTFFRLGVVVTVSFVMFLPLLRFITESENNRYIVFYRSLTRIGTEERAYPGPVGLIFLDNLWDAMTMMAWDNGSTWVHSVTARPALEIVSAALFYTGFLLLGLRYLHKRRWEDLALIVSVPFLMMPSILSLAFPMENPSLNRTGGAIIPVFIIAALSLDSILAAVKKRAGSRWGPRLAWGLAGLLMLWSSVNNYDLIFRQYYEQFRRSSWNTTELGGVIRGFADSIGSEDSAWVVPYPHWVDTRLVGINAGVYIRDYALPRERLVDTLGVPGPKLFLFNQMDVDTLSDLTMLYPEGDLQTYESEVEGKDFWIFLVLGPES